MGNAVEAIWTHATTRPEAVALRVDGDEWTFGQLRNASQQWAARLLDAGVAPGDRVLLAGGTQADWVFAYHGVLAVGAIAVTVNPHSTEAELGYFLHDCGATLALVADATHDAVAAAAAELDVPAWRLGEGARDLPVPADLPRTVAPDSGAVIMYTSGTTGKPKGAQLTHHGIRGSAQSVIEAIEVTDDDHFGTALPLFHVFGQVTVMRTAYEAGVPITLMSKFDARALLETAARHRVTLLAGVPTMWTAMANAAPDIDDLDFSCLRLALSGGAGLPTKVADQFDARYGCEILAGYGLTETAGAGACPRVGAPRKLGSAGVAWPGVELAIFDTERNPVPVGGTGEIAIRCEMNLKDYWNRPDATARAWHDDWFLTGDLGRMDEEGYLWVVDRIKDLIIRGGYNVYPKELEDVLYSHPDILEAAVVGVPDDRLGEEIAAVIVLRDGREFDVTRMQEWMAERVAAYKTPRIYHVAAALPKGSTGKILKREINRTDVSSRGHRTRKATASAPIPLA
ncbi:AMP-dependent synthetase [Aeromicrobium phragmitis]|uniref:AMP-dependent synthetase n=1 Tax=Aeromicrobium phragmitis TaxID=2478914 RepID=A0A3L8PMS0_9ACTN|nr:AMP-binding protein [Aeromicrobium phragmitis]RLV55342.1 AMP-dependent synthetase [Aeromicrobium phragmitis]